MDLRILTEPQQGASYDDLLRVAKATEDAGYEGFFRSDHYLKMGDVPGLPGPTDAWITLAGLARETNRIRLGTLVTAATFRHPSVLAISVSQVDQMSAGRIEFGLGSGYFAEEHRAYGIPLPEVNERFDLYTEQLEIITGLWETQPGETFNFAGKHYQLIDSPGLPKPAQKPRPPIIIGGTGKKRTPQLAARFASEVNLIFVDSATAASHFASVDRAATEIGRNSAEISRSAALVLAVGRGEAELSRRIEAISRSFPALVQFLERPGYNLAGSPAEVVDKIGQYREETNISRLYFEILDLSDLDQIELAASDIMPQLD